MTDNPAAESSAADWMGTLGFNEIPTAQAGRRLGIRWAPWMGDWFTSWSPRNDNENAEGSWAEWVELALAILADPMTEKVRPAVYRHEAHGWHGDEPTLTPEQLRDRFGKKS